MENIFICFYVIYLSVLKLIILHVILQSINEKQVLVYI